MWLTIGFVTVGDHLRGRFAAPRHHTQRACIGTQQHIGIGRLNKVPVVVGVLARDRLHHNRLG